MVQPTSSYYHAVYGATIDVASNNELFIFRGYYVERPKFEEGGYVDQEYGSFGAIGTKLNKSKLNNIYAFFGYGKMGGYLATIKNEGSTSSETNRTYEIPGPMFSLEYGLRLKNFFISLEHISFIGHVDDTQLNARVAWPYNFFMFKTSYLW